MCGRRIREEELELASGRGRDERMDGWTGRGYKSRELRCSSLQSANSQEIEAEQQETYGPKTRSHQERPTICRYVVVARAAAGGEPEARLKVKLE